MHSIAFNNLLSGLDDLTAKQTFEVIIHLRELGKGDIDVNREANACFNALTEDEAVLFFRYAKSQFSSEDWETILEVI